MSFALTQTLNLTFLYVTVSTLNPTVGIVVTLWFNLSLYRIATTSQLLFSIHRPALGGI